MIDAGIVAVAALRLTVDIYCRSIDPGADDPRIPEGSLVRDLWRRGRSVWHHLTRFVR